MQRFALFCVVLLIPTNALALNAARQDFGTFMGHIASTIQGLIYLVSSAIMLMYIFGIVRNYQALATGEADVMKKFYLWGIIAVFMSASLFGLVSIIQNTFLPTTQIPDNPREVDPIPECLLFGNKGANC